MGGVGGVLAWMTCLREWRASVCSVGSVGGVGGMLLLFFVVIIEILS